MEQWGSCLWRSAATLWDQPETPFVSNPNVYLRGGCNMKPLETLKAVVAVAGATTLLAVTTIACAPTAPDSTALRQPTVGQTGEEGSAHMPPQATGPATGSRIVILSKPQAPPQSMLELVKGMEIIGIGTVGPLAKETMESAALPFDTLGTPVPPHPTPYLYYGVTFEQVFRDDGTVAAGKPVLIRFAGTMNEQSVRVAEESYAHVQPGVRGLIFLSEFQGTYQIARTGYGLLDISGNEVRYWADGRTPKAVDFTTNSAPSAFVSELKETIAKDARGK